ncbi:MAG: hypothetical protein LBL45_02085 [Treponema sp.]|nr:hypothetical protein [Treponema sp.]
MSEFQIIDLNGKINEIHILLATDTPVRHYEQNGKYVVGFRYDVPATPMKNRLGFIANLEDMAKVQSNSFIQLASFMPQVRTPLGMKRDMKFNLRDCHCEEQIDEAIASDAPPVIQI